MTSLRQTQDLFMDAVYGQPAPGLARRLTHAENFSIYQNNALFILTDVLKNSFPVTVRLVGEDFFRTLCRDFIARHPPEKPNLNDFGRILPSFLSRQKSLAAYPFVPDVAGLEWDMHEAYLSPLEPALMLDRITGIPENALDNFVLPLQSCLRLRQSPYPVDRIWQSHQPESPAHENIDLAGDPAYLAILREQTQVIMIRLTKGAFCFLASLGGGQTLLPALNDALMADAAFDPEQHLGLLFKLGLFADKSKGAG